MFYKALYQPVDTENISEKAKKFIGKTIAVQDGGQEEIKPGVYQVVYIAVPNFGLIPNRDLQNTTSIPYREWTKLSEDNKTQIQPEAEKTLYDKGSGISI
ncbi:MAG: hypothetical protein R6U68_02750 [Desulfobacteraceae bacterium]